MRAGGELIRNLRGQIAERLRNDVLSGRIQEGSFLRQEDLIARFGVSCTPIREALIQLTNEGLLESIPNSGVKVRKQAPDHVQKFLMPIRHTIEEYALELCFDKLNEDDFKKWDQILERLRAACEKKDRVEIAEHDMEFHRMVVDRCGEPILRSMWNLILSQLILYQREAYLQYENLMDLYREHCQIIAVLRTGDKEAAVRMYSSRIGMPGPDSRMKKGRKAK